MNSADWYARKLAGLRGNTPQPQPTPPTSHPGYAAPQHRPPGPTADVTPTINTEEDVRNLAGAWKGGKGTKTETTKCPQCGSDHYFSRSNAPGVMNVQTGQQVKPNPVCHGCGYAGRDDWIQSSINH